MKKLILITFLLTLILFLTSCNVITNEEPTEDIVATEVERRLTEAALLAEPTITETIAPPPTATEPVIEDTPTQTPTATETSMPTPDPEDLAQVLGSPAWTDDFSGSESPWDYDSPEASIKPVDGYLNITAKAIANYHSWQVASPMLQNAYVEATLEMSNCSGRDRFGLVVRASSDAQAFYFMAITCDGQWGFFRMAEDVNIIEIEGFQPGAPLSNGTQDSHRVGIWMENTNFKFYIDGEEVGTASDNTLIEAGYTGFLIAYASTPGYTVRVDQLQYWHLP